MKVAIDISEGLYKLVKKDYEEKITNQVLVGIIAKGTPLSKGHWIEHPHEWGDNWQYSRYECSCCNDWAYFDTDYCPSCGAKMVESEDKE